jgi:DNA anti-recombination protein RmuC
LDDIFKKELEIYTSLKDENNRLKEMINSLKEQHREQVRAQEIKNIQMRKEQDKVLNQIKTTKNDISRTLEI